LHSKQIAYILLLTAPGKDEKVLDNLRSIPEVSEATLVFGEFDIYAMIEVENINELNQVTTKIRKIEGITKTSTLIKSNLK